MSDPIDTRHDDSDGPAAVDPPPAKMTDDEVFDLAREILFGRVFTSLQAPSVGDIPLVFMPIALGGEEILKGMIRDQVAFVWESLDKAGPRSINGLPVFFSCRTVNTTDAVRVQRRYEALKDALDAQRPGGVP